MTENSQNQVSDSQNYGCGCLLSLIVLGLLGLIVMPSYLKPTHINRQSEAKTYIGSMNRAQQAYFLEKKQFANAIPPLGLGIETQTKNYTYLTYATDKAAFNYGIARSTDAYTYRKRYFGLFSRRVKEPLRSYVGGVFIKQTTSDEWITISILCEATAIGTTKPAEPTYIDGQVACGEGTSEL
ncbi:MAG: general secretion pathway protein GspH [Symploca sp. SIO2E6]|nr:general secretion pathway protein GspH [Symploca sp. SIO2E6]